MTKAKSDDLEAVRQVIAALENFEVVDQERILRWAREKIGLVATSSPAKQTPAQTPTTQSSSAASTFADIGTFISTKNPKSDVQFAAAVAYFYRFEAPESERRETINTEILQDSCRKVAGRARLAKPAQTLVNAYNQGLLDKSGDRGEYRINSVGENLVAIALPPGSGQIKAKRSAKKKKPAKAKRGKKKR